MEIDLDQTLLFTVNKISPLKLDAIKDKLDKADHILIFEEGIENGFYSQFLINYPELASKSMLIAILKSFWNVELTYICLDKPILMKFLS